jgi:hypothetical protein
MYPHSGITYAKMLDFVLWQTRSGPKRDSRANVIEPLTPSACPRCGASAVAKIVYGLPAFDEELVREVEAGRVVLGGCCVWEGMPQWRCRTCNHEWDALPVVDHAGG